MLVALVTSEANVTDVVLLRELTCLADSGWLRFEQQAAATPMVRIVQRPGEGELRGGERVALDWIRQRAGNQTDVPLSAILDREGADAQQWWRQYAAALVAEAKAAGLTWQPVGDRGACAVIAASAATFGLAAAAAGAGIGVALMAALLTSVFPGLVVALALMKPRLTRAGRRMARQVARGGSGLVPEGRTRIPDVAPLPSGQAWSSYGGRWHTVTVLSAGATQARLRQDRQGDRNEKAEVTEIVGQVVRRWSTSQWEGGQISGRTVYFYSCCIDDGATDEGWTFRVMRDEFGQLIVGDIVSFGVKPPYSVRLVQPAPGSRRSMR